MLVGIKVGTVGPTDCLASLTEVIFRQLHCGSASRSVDTNRHEGAVSSVETVGSCDAEVILRGIEEVVKRTTDRRSSLSGACGQNVIQIQFNRISGVRQLVVEVVEVGKVGAVIILLGRSSLDGHDDGVVDGVHVDDAKVASDEVVVGVVVNVDKIAVTNVSDAQLVNFRRAVVALSA